MRVSDKPVYFFENIEVDPAQGCIRRAGQEIYLRQQPLQVLLYLLAHRGRAIGKEELIENLWKDTAVTDNALLQCIMDIRKALADDARQPRWIKTLPKVGYRFMGQVEELYPDRPSVIEAEEVTTYEVEIKEEITEDAEPAETPLALTPAGHTEVRGRRRLIYTVGLAALMGVCVVYVGQRMLRPDAQSAEVTLPQLPGKTPVAVMYFENQSANAELDWLREGLTDMLITGLSRSKSLTVLSRGQLHLLFERTGHTPADRLRLEAALDIARRSRAEVILLGSFAVLNGTIRIEAHLHEADTGQLIAAESLMADSPDRILKQVDLLSLKLSSHLGRPVRQDENLGLADVTTSNLEAYRCYSLAVEKAMALHNTEALALLQKAVELDPQFAMAHARIGYTYAVSWIYADKGRLYLERAFQLSHRLTERDRLYIHAWYAIANLDYPGAIQAFREVVSRYPMEIEAYQILGRLLVGESRLEESVDVFQQALTMDADAKDIYNGLGMSYSYLGKHEEAIAAHRQYVALAPGEPNAYDSLGLSYQGAGRYEEAVREYNRALAINPGFEVARVHLANTYFQQGRYREAIDEYKRYVQVAPSNLERGRGYRGIASIYLKKGERDRARLAAALEVKYEKVYVWNSLLLALEQGDTTQVERLKELHFANWGYKSRGVRMPLRYTFYYRGYLGLKEGRAAEAIENFKEALRHHPPIWDIEPFEDCLANAYLELGRLDEAIAEYERILRLNPNYPLAHYHLAQAYGRKGEVDRAAAEYGRFLQVWGAADSDIREVITAKAKLDSISTSIARD